MALPEGAPGTGRGIPADGPPGDPRAHAPARCRGPGVPALTQDAPGAYVRSGPGRTPTAPGAATMVPMSGEILTILAVGIALAGLVLTALHRLEGRLAARIAAGESRLEARIAAGESRLEARMDGIDTRLDGIDARLDRIEARVSGTETELSTLRERMGRIEGLLDGLREAVAGQRDAVAGQREAIHDLRERFTRRAIA